MTIRSINPAL